MFALHTCIRRRVTPIELPSATRCQTHARSCGAPACLGGLIPSREPGRTSYDCNGALGTQRGCDHRPFARQLAVSWARGPYPAPTARQSGFQGPTWLGQRASRAERRARPRRSVAGARRGGGGGGAAASAAAAALPPQLNPAACQVRARPRRFGRGPRRGARGRRLGRPARVAAAGCWAGGAQARPVARPYRTSLPPRLPAPLGAAGGPGPWA